MSLLADACTTLRATPALVQTTVDIQMFKVLCATDASTNKLVRKRMADRASGRRRSRVLVLAAVVRSRTVVQWFAPTVMAWTAKARPRRVPAGQHRRPG